MKVTVVGSGMVGSTFAYRLLVSGLASEIVLIDINRNRAEGEAEDMRNAVPIESSVRVYAGDYPDAADSNFVILTAGLSNLKDGTRLDLCQKNAAIFHDIVPRLAAVAPHAFYLVASNPMDVMTYATIKYSGVDPTHVIGSGTVLDSARFRSYLAERLEIAPQEITAYSLGEHGDSQVPIYSSVNIRGVSLASYLQQTGKELPEADRQAINERVRKDAYWIIERKGATYYGIASSLVRILQAIWRDEGVVLPVSSLAHGEYGMEDVCLAMPSLVGGTGVRRVLDLSLSESEYAAVRQSGDVLKSYVQQLP